MKISLSLLILFILFPTVLVFSQSDSLTIPYYIIDSAPQNADVYVNDLYSGKTPFRILMNDSSEVSVKLKLKGYLDYSLAIAPSDVSRYKLVSLVNTDLKKVPGEIVTEDESHYFNKRKKIIPITLSAILTAGAGISAYYFKSLAIDNLDAYNNSGDGSALDRKRKYDIISGVSLGLFQVGFSALLYFLLIDN